VGEGEWARAKHGVRGTRGWKKLHLGVDRSGVIIGHVLTEGTVDDATTAIELIKAVHGGVASVTGDAAYDSIAFYDAAGARGATVVVPPTATARVSRRKRRSSARDRTIQKVHAVGRRRGRRHLATIDRPVSRTPSSATSRSSGRVFTRVVWQGRGLRPSSHATSSIR
jgi:DDE family transposase